LHWPIGVAYDNTDSIFSPGAISCFVFLSTILDFEAQPVESKVYNRNTSLHFPKLFPFLFLCPPCWILSRVTAVHSFPDSHFRFPVPRSSLAVLVPSDENWTFIPEVDYFRSDFRTTCFFVMLEWVFVTDIVLDTKWNVKAFPVPLLLTNRLLEQYTKNLKFQAIKLSDFKMDLIKWQLN